MADDDAYLASLSKLTEAFKSGGFDEQCGAICYRTSAERGLEVLLISSLTTGRWIIPKGNIARKEASHRAAEREAEEEAGLIGKAGKKPFGYYSYVKAEGVRPCIVNVHLLKVEGKAKTFAEKHKRALEWVTPLEASRRVQEAELKGLLLKLSQAPLP